MRLGKPKHRRRRAFVDLQPLDVAGELAVGAPQFLHRFDERALRAELGEAGILDGLARRGYPDVALRIEIEAGEQRLLVSASGSRTSLIDLRMAEGTLPAGELEPGAFDSGPLSILAIHWLSMQDPKARFTRERPRLPGQRYPGLGLAQELILRIHSWAAAWGKDALVNFPEYYHNAVFYSALYRFASPAREGRFQALRRDLAGLPVAAASQAVDAGRVLEQATGRSVLWQTGEMITPLSARVAAYLASPGYAAAVAAARDALRFKLKLPSALRKARG